MNRKTHLVYLALLIGLCAFALLRGCFDMGSEIKTQQRGFTVAKTDTVTVIGIDTVVKWRERVRVISKANRIDTVSDTIIQEKPFVAMFDTIASGDTIAMQFKFPEKEFALSINPKPDSVKIETKIQTITVTNTVFLEPSFAEKIGYGAIGFFIGSGVGLGVGIYITK